MEQTAATRRGTMGFEGLAPGDDVEVWCRSTGTWARGFVLVKVGDDGATLRRVADRKPLPVLFSGCDVRRITTGRWR